MVRSANLYIFPSLLVVSSVVGVIVWINFDHVSRVVWRRPMAFTSGVPGFLPSLLPIASSSKHPPLALAGLEQRPEQQQRTEQPQTEQPQTEQPQAEWQQTEQQLTQKEQVQQGQKLVVSAQRQLVTLKLPLVSANDRDTSFDELLYDTLVANGVTSLQVLHSLDPKSMAALLATLGVDADTMFRVFGMMYGFRGNFHRKDYAFAIEPAACPATFTGTVMFVFTLPKARADRNRIRSTWAKELLALRQPSGGDESRQLRVQFIMGRTRGMTADATAIAVADEVGQHNDLLLVDFEEDYHNLTLKSLLMMRWTAQRCPTARLLVKVDADVQVVPHNFLSALDRYCLPARRAFLGWVSSGDPVHRDRSSKWYVPPAVYPGWTYPVFAHGPCYVVTVDLLSDLLSTALTLSYLHLEDVFVSAVCVQHMKDVQLVAIPDFVTWNCKNQRTAVYHDTRC